MAIEDDPAFTRASEAYDTLQQAQNAVQNKQAGPSDLKNAQDELTAALDQLGGGTGPLPPRLDDDAVEALNRMVETIQAFGREEASQEEHDQAIAEFTTHAVRLGIPRPNRWVNR